MMFPVKQTMMGIQLHGLLIQVSQMMDAVDVGLVPFSPPAILRIEQRIETRS